MRVTIDVPDSFFKEISFGFIKPEREIKFILAVKLVEAGRISTGRAAEWLGISKPRFLQEMGRYGLSAFPIDEETIKEDIMNVKESIS
jgi:predicted HTH domain antitoxin